MCERFVCRDGLNVVGLSTSKLEQLIDNGFIRNRSDLFSLSQYEGEIASFDGWGEKSAGKLMQAIAKARTTTFRQFFYCLGIPGCGHDVAKNLAKKPDVARLLSCPILLVLLISLILYLWMGSGMYGQRPCRTGLRRMKQNTKNC